MFLDYRPENTSKKKRDNIDGLHSVCLWFCLYLLVCLPLFDLKMELSRAILHSHMLIDSQYHTGLDQIFLRNSKSQFVIRHKYSIKKKSNINDSPLTLILYQAVPDRPPFKSHIIAVNSWEFTEMFAVDNAEESLQASFTPLNHKKVKKIVAGPAMSLP